MNEETMYGKIYRALSLTKKILSYSYPEYEILPDSQIEHLTDSLRKIEKKNCFEDEYVLSVFESDKINTLSFLEKILRTHRVPTEQWMLEDQRPDGMIHATENLFKLVNEIKQEPMKQEIFAVMVLGKQAPSVTHDSYESAEREAKRLCEQTKQTVYVLKAVTKIELKTVEVTDLTK
jgi:hypothetical protein